MSDKVEALKRWAEKEMQRPADVDRSSGLIKAGQGLFVGICSLALAPSPIKKAMPSFSKKIENLGKRRFSAFVEWTENLGYVGCLKKEHGEKRSMREVFFSTTQKELKKYKASLSVPKKWAFNVGLAVAAGGALATLPIWLPLFSGFENQLKKDTQRSRKLLASSARTRMLAEIEKGNGEGVLSAARTIYASMRGDFAESKDFKASEGFFLWAEAAKSQGWVVSSRVRISGEADDEEPADAPIRKLVAYAALRELSRTTLAIPSSSNLEDLQVFIKKMEVEEGEGELSSTLRKLEGQLNGISATYASSSMTLFGIAYGLRYLSSSEARLSMTDLWLASKELDKSSDFMGGVILAGKYLYIDDEVNFFLAERERESIESFSKPGKETKKSRRI